MAGIKFDVTLDSSQAAVSAKEIQDILSQVVKTTENGVASTKQYKAGLKALGEEMKAQKKIIEDMGSDLKKAEESISETKKKIDDVTKAGGAVRTANGQLLTVEQLNKELQNQQQHYERIKTDVSAATREMEAMQVVQKILEDNAVGLRTKMMQIRESMMRMVDAGKAGTPEFQRLAQEAGILQRTLKLAQAQMAYFADPNRHLTTLKTGLQGVAGAAGLVTGVMGLFNENSEKMAKIQTKVQSILAVVVGLETTYNLIKKTSNIMLAIEEVKTWAIAKARGVQAAATTAATVAQEGLNTAMKSNPVGAMIALLATLGTAIYTVVKAFTSETEAEKKAREEREAHTKAMREQREQWINSVAEMAGNEIANYQKLRREWNSLGNDMKAKEKFIKDNQDAFHSLGVSINSVSDAERFLVQNTDQVVAAIMARAKAAAYQELVTEEMKKRTKEMLDSDTIKGGKFKRVFKEGQQLSAASISDIKRQYKINDETGDYRVEDGKWVLTKKGAARFNKGSEEYAKNQRALVDQRIEESEKTIEKYNELLTKEIEDSKKKLKDAGIKEYKRESSKPTGGSGGNKEVLKTFQELSEEALKIQKNRIDAEISAEKEYTKKWEDLQRQKISIQAEMSERQAKQTESSALKDLDKSYQGGKSGLSEKEYQERRLQIITDTEAHIAAIRAKADKDNADLVEKRMKREDERAKKERQNQIEFLKAYGDMEQQRLAIAQEYEEKIAAETDPMKRAQLNLDKEKALEELNTKQVQESIDWQGVFSDLQGHTRDYLVGLRDQLQNLLNTGSLPVDQMAVIQQKIQEINGEISKQNGLFSFVGDRQREYNRLVEESANAQERLTKAKEAESFAEVDVRSAQEEINQYLTSLGKEAVTSFDSSILEGLDENSEEYKQMSALLSVLATSEGRLNEARQKTAKATNDAVNAENRAQRSSSQAVADWFSDAQQFITEKGIDQLPALFDSIGLSSVSDKLGKGLSGFNNAAGAASDFASHNYIGAAVKAIGAIKDFGSALGIGGGNAAEIQRTIERLTERNNRLIQSLDDLKDVMEKQGGAMLVKSYDKGYALQKEINENYKAMAQAQASYHHAHGSWNSYWGGFSAQEIQNLSGQIGRTWNGDIWGLTPEEMKILRSNVDMWEKIGSTGKGGYGGRVQEYLNSYIEQAGKLEELTESLYDGLTQISFDSLYGSFVSTLTDMDKSAEDLAEDFEGYMRNAVISSMAAEKYRPLLENWRKGFAAAMEDGLLTEAERKALYEEGGTFIDKVTGERTSYQGWNTITNMALADREALKNLQGWSSSYSQSASSKAFGAMSQDTAEELNGRFTALQIAGESINTQMVLAVESLNALSANSSTSNTAVTEMRNMMTMTNSYLEDMVKYAKMTYNSFGEKLDTIAANTR